MYENGDLYTGECRGNIPDGHGILTKVTTYIDCDPENIYSDSSVTREKQTTYEGSFVDGVLHGKAKICYPDGSIYEGDIVFGVQTGWGKIYSLHNKYTYEGDFIENVQSGKAAIKYVNGCGYTGEVVDGAPYGIGVMICPSGTYDGHFVKGNRQGKGKQTWTKGNSYFADAISYEGDWHLDQVHGHGKMTFSDGSFFDGQWEYWKKLYK
jgi:hypothetical protein